jgi:peptidoglycan/xylan/chitin deacetylase (PgdA/CDA1 family)
MFHSVGLDQYQWVYAHISESLDSFAQKIRTLHHNGYKTSTMKEIVTAQNESNPAKCICLTFDDGYLDNWTFAFPLLRKYGMKATIFVSPEFVDTRNIIRPQVELDFMDQRVGADAEQYAGFLTWREMREMGKSGLVEVQSHALTHTWYFKGPTIVDFWHPGAATEPGGPVWMLWNEFPDFKPYYLTRAGEREKDIPYGTPIYEHDKALVTRRYIPCEKELTDELVNHVVQHSGVNFFQQNNWRCQLSKIVISHRDIKSVQCTGRFETDEEYRQRVKFELAESKKRIEENLCKNVEGLCWPGGGVTEEVVQIAREVGYKYFILPCAWKVKVESISGKYSDMIPRIGSMQRIIWHGRDLGPCTGREFLWYLKRHQGSFLHKWLGRSTKLTRYIYQRAT